MRHTKQDTSAPHPATSDHGRSLTIPSSPPYTSSGAQTGAKTDRDQSVQPRGGASTRSLVLSAIVRQPASIAQRCSGVAWGG